MKPVVALIGRPNVGKSTLFNRLCGRKKAIVQDEPGVTRDRHYTNVTFNERDLLLVDTGGFEPRTNDDMLLAMRQQTELAIEEADVCVLVVDGAVGMRPEDKEIGRRLRKASKPVIIAVNKIDSDKHVLAMHEFQGLGVEAVIPISAEHGRGKDELVAAIMKLVPAAPEKPEADIHALASVCVLGRPNAGKSSLINRLLGEERHLATPIAGTTRDSINSFIKRNGDTYCFIDTAGVRRKARISDQLEEFMVMSSLRSMDEADICVIVLDATELASEQDIKIAALAHERGTGIVLAVNKWDLPHPKLNPQNIRDVLEDKAPFLSYARIVYMSAKTGQGLDQLFTEIKATLVERQRRVTTGELNRLVERLTEQNMPVFRGTKRGKIYFSTQVSVAPPTFVMAVNDPERFTNAYSRYLQNALRKEYGFAGTPIVIKFRPRHEANTGEFGDKDGRKERGGVRKERSKEQRAKRAEPAAAKSKPQKRKR